MGNEYVPQQTDYAGWRLRVSEDSHGQHKWAYLPEGQAREAWPQNKVDKYWLGLDVVGSGPHQLARMLAHPRHRAHHSWTNPKHLSKLPEMEFDSSASFRARTATLRPSMEVSESLFHLHAMFKSFKS